MAEIVVAEFLYRGRTPSEKMTPTWHVILAQDVESFGETKPVYGDAMTPEQAEAAGFPLSVITAEINSAALAAADTLKAQLLAERAEHEAAVSALKAENEALLQQASQAKDVAFAAAIEELTTKKDELRAAEIAELTGQHEAAIARFTEAADKTIATLSAEIERRDNAAAATGEEMAALQARADAAEARVAELLAPPAPPPEAPTAETVTAPAE